MGVMLSKVLRQATPDALFFWCPGCTCPHMVVVGEGPGPRWTWDGCVDKPTFSPSLLMRRPYGDPPVDQVCHSFITAGRIQFLGDCTHALAGQTVDIPDWPLHREGE